MPSAVRIARMSTMNKPTRLEHGSLRFLIHDAPSNETLPCYVTEMLNFGVTDLVRTCELTYDEDQVEQKGIRTHNMMFPDGDPPPETILSNWMRLVDAVCATRGGVAVHCVAGLGRAPVLVTVALIEKGMDPIEAITFVRRHRNGAMSRKQLQYLKSYKRRKAPTGCCSIM